MARDYESQASIATKINFAIGAPAEAILGLAFNAFNFFFYNQILGLSGTLSGTAVAIALVFDAVTDPLVGSLSDRWRSRLGRRHPFMFAAPLPVFVCFFFIYSPPEGLAQVEWIGILGMPLFLWFTAFTILFRSSMTLFHVPHLAMGAELSTNYQERTVIMSVNGFFGLVGGLAAGFIAFTWFFAPTPEHENGLFNAEAYPVFAAYAAIVGVILMVASAALTMRNIPDMPKAPENLPRFRLIDVLKEMWEAWQNMNYRVLLLGLFFLSATLGIRETLGLHMNTYFWEFLPEQLRWFGFFGAGGFLAATALTPLAHRIFDKKPSIVGTVSFLVLFFIMPVSLRLLGWFPENHTDLLFWSIALFTLLGALTGGILTISVMSALADIADEHELTTNRRQEGIFYSARSFFAKAISGFGHVVAGIAIDVIGFPIGTEPGTVPEDKLIQLGLVDGPIGAIPAVIAILFYLRYTITRERHQEIQAELAARKAADGLDAPASVPASGTAAGK